MFADVFICSYKIVTALHDFVHSSSLIGLGTFVETAEFG